MQESRYDHFLTFSKATERKASQSWLPLFISRRSVANQFPRLVYETSTKGSIEWSRAASKDIERDQRGFAFSIVSRCSVRSRRSIYPWGELSRCLSAYKGRYPNIYSSARGTDAPWRSVSNGEASRRPPCIYCTDESLPLRLPFYQNEEILLPVNEGILKSYLETELLTTVPLKNVEVKINLFWQKCWWQHSSFHDV